MYYTPSQKDIHLILQQTKDVFIKIELLNRQFKVLEMIHGNLISDNFTCGSDAPQRRSYNCDIFVSDASFLTGTDGLTNISAFTTALRSFAAEKLLTGS